jgi:hypothetical protein
MSALAGSGAPRALVPGDPDEVEWLGREFGRYAAGACAAAGLLRRIDTGGWVGPAGEAFRSAVGELPDKLDRGRAAFARAAQVLLSYSGVLREAQADAALASRRYGEAEAVTEAWRRRPEGAGPAYDPGLDERRAAEHLLADARSRVAVAGARAAAVLQEAREGAPREPGLLSKAVHAVGSFFQGAGEATRGLLELGYKTSPAYALIDPKGYLAFEEQLGRGLLHGVEHPKELGKALLDWDTWRDDPARAMGHLVPDLLLTAATMGAGEAAVAGERAAVGAERLSVAGEAVAELTEERLAVEFAEFAAEGLPSRSAATFQTSDLYPHQDDWVDRVAQPGEVFWVGEPYPGQFVVPDSELAKVGSSARTYYEGVQVGPRDLGAGPRYRDGGLGGYRVERPFPVAEAIAEANRQFGEGGLREVYLPKELTELADGGWITRIGEHPLPDDIDARIPETGLEPAAAGGRMAP